MLARIRELLLDDYPGDQRETIELVVQALDDREAARARVAELERALHTGSDDCRSLTPAPLL